MNHSESSQISSITEFSALRHWLSCDQRGVRSLREGERAGVRRRVSKGIQRKHSEYVLFQTETTRSLNPNTTGTPVHIPILMSRVVFITSPGPTANNKQLAFRLRAGRLPAGEGQSQTTHFPRRCSEANNSFPSPPLQHYRQDGMSTLPLGSWLHSNGISR